jgi:EAL domain-containing protein (putative c-di-GMP-specific phosphodiesterase class I)
VLIDSDSLTIVCAVAGLGTSLGIPTTAEGVETAEQFAQLREVGCTHVQGYYFAHAVRRGHAGPTPQARGDSQARLRLRGRPSNLKVATGRGSARPSFGLELRNLRGT